jgi:hypothetical protein
MGHTLPSASQQIINEQDALGKFRRALRKEVQIALDNLFRGARYHVAAMGFASHLLPFEVMHLAMLLEEHKLTDHLQTKINRLENESEGTSRLALCLSRRS